MRVVGWAGFLCALLVTRAVKVSEESGHAKDLSPLKRISRSFCLTSEITVTPTEDELFWRVGEVQEVWCSVVDATQSLTSANLTLLKNLDGPPLPHQAVNETTIQATLNLTQPESYQLICQSDGGQMCMSQVHVGYEPLDVENLQCVSHNWETLTCNWTLPYNPAQETNNDYVPYLLSLDDPSTASLSSCGDGSLLGDACTCPDTCCLWTGPEYFAVSPEVVVIFKVQNNLGSATFNHTIDNYAVVLPNAMKEVTVEAAAGRLEALVGWELPAPMSTFADDAAGVVVRVDHRLTDDGGGGKGEWIQGEVVECHGDSCKTGQQAVPLEHWWCRYEVRVRLRSAAAPQPVEEDGWWSDWQPRHVNTSAAAPDSPPGVGPGTFQVTERGFAGLSDLTLAWQTLPTLLHNGPDFGYLAQLWSGGGGDGGRLRDDEMLKEVAVTDNFAVFSNVSSSAPYTLRVSARNSEGGGPWAAVQVAAAAARPAPPLLPVVVQHGGAGQQDALYEVRWAPGGGGTYYTVYLCTGEQDPCTGQLYWVSAGNASAANFTLQDFGLQDDAPPRVSFAVSAEDDSGNSSGLSWDRCGAPEPYKNLRGAPSPDEPIPGSSGVELKWTLSCSFWAGVVQEAEATCCRGTYASPDNCTGERVPAFGEPWTGVVKVAGLEAGVEYTAWLRLHYRGGASPWADGQSFTTTHAGAEVWLIVVVASCGVLVTVGLVFGLIYSKRKVVDNLKKLRLKPSLPSGLVPVMRQQDPLGSFRAGGEGKGDDGKGEGGGGVPVSESTVSASVENPSYSHILPTVFGGRPSLSLEDQRREEISFGRGVTQGGRLTHQEQQQDRSEADDNLFNTASERFTPRGGSVVSSWSSEHLASPSTSEPLLQGSHTPHYISPYFSESEGEGRDTTTKPLFPGGYVGLSGPWVSGENEEGKACLPLPTGTWSGGKSTRSGISGGSSGYVPPSECTKLPGVFVTPVSSGYVTAQHGEHIATGSPGYVQADAFPHPIIPEEGDSIKNPEGSGWYASTDFPMINQALPDTNTIHDPVTTTTDSPALNLDPEDHFPPTVSLKGDVDASEEQKQIEKPSYVSLPDAQLTMERVAGEDAAASDDKLDMKGSEDHGRSPRPGNDAPAPGYIAVQPPDFGKPVQDTEAEAKDDKVHYHNPNFLSALFSKPDQAHQGSPASLVSPALQVSAPEVPGDLCEARYYDISHWGEEGNVGGYVPLSVTGADEAAEKENPKVGSNSWFNSLLSLRTPRMASETPLTGISFIMLNNRSSRNSSVGAGTEIKESNVDSAGEEGGERVAGEGAESERPEIENLTNDGLSKGYSRVGEPPE